MSDSGNIEDMCSRLETLIEHARDEAKLDADIVFELVVESSSEDKRLLNHCLHLRLNSQKDFVREKDVEIPESYGLGPLTYVLCSTTQTMPNFVRRNIDGRTWLVGLAQLEEVWDCLVQRIRIYESTWSDHPLLQRKRPLHVAVVNMGYFSAFESDISVGLEIGNIPAVYHSHASDISRGENTSGNAEALPCTPVLFLKKPAITQERIKIIYS